MSAIGSARARGPEMWSDIGVLGPGWSARRLVGGLVQQRPQSGVLQRLRGARVVQHLLEGPVDALSLPDLLHRAPVVPRVGGGRSLRAEHEGPQGPTIGKTLVALGVPEDHIEECKRRTGREEVLHVRVPRTVEAR